MRIKHYLSFLLGGLLVNITAIHAQDTNPAATDTTHLPGANFSLQGALEMFKKAASPEEFEKLLNTQDNKVNNLDLNGDGNIDYIKVVNKRENDVHVFVLQALISETESQDIAVIELEKTAADNAVVQIVGDEDIYGEQTIVEPSSGTDKASSENDEKAEQPYFGSGPHIAASYAPTRALIVNVWFWPCVRFVYAPAYTVWISPFSWRVRPIWWHPWRPMPWAVYRPYRYYYAPHYTIVRTNRIVYAPRIYRPMRVTSVTVRTRNQVVVNRYRATPRPARSFSGPRTGATRSFSTPRGNGSTRTFSTPRVNGTNRTFNGPNRSFNSNTRTFSSPNGNRQISRQRTTISGPRGSATRTRTGMSRHH